MALDPALFATTPDGRKREKVEDVDRRVSNLETSPTVRVGSGAPSTAATSLRAGTPYIDYTNSRLYFVVGDPANPAGNTWKSVLLA
jgi:hypothetical protein